MQVIGRFYTKCLYHAIELAIPKNPMFFEKSEKSATLLKLDFFRILNRHSRVPFMNQFTV